MSNLKVSPDLALPLDVASQAVAILGIREGGKTNTASVFSEELLAQHQPLVVIDPTDAWWGLRSGFPVFIFGGPHGDLPLQETDSKVVAEFVVTEGASIILSLRHLRKNAQRRFVTEFCEEIYHLKGKPENRAPLTVFIDEAPLFVPQKVIGEVARTVGAVEDLVARGRNAGFGVVLISQRSATINKDVLTQCDTIIAHRLPSPQDKKALGEWFEENASIEAQKEVLSSLAKLPTGRAWVWSPRLDVFKQVQIRLRKTFDSSATPKRGEQPAQPKRLEEVDLGKLKDKLAASIEKARQDDPKVLRARIGELEEQWRKWASEPAVNLADREVLRAAKAVADGVRRELVLISEQFDRAVGDLMRAQSAAADRLKQCHDRLEGIVAPASTEYRATTTIPPTPKGLRPQDVLSSGRIEVARASPGAAGSGLGKAERAILTVLAQRHPKSSSRAQLSVLSGYSVTSSSFANALSGLRSKGYCNGGGDNNGITDAGMRAVGDFEAAPSGGAVIQWWMSKLGKAERCFLDYIAQRNPHGVAKHELSTATGYSETSSSFSNALSKLRTLELITRGTPIQLNPEVFQWSEPVTLKQQIQCVGREIGMRKNAYPKFVQSGRLSQEKADMELAHMSAVYRTLKALEALSNGITNEEQKAPADASTAQT